MQVSNLKSVWSYGQIIQETLWEGEVRQKFFVLLFLYVQLLLSSFSTPIPTKLNYNEYIHARVYMPIYKVTKFFISTQARITLIFMCSLQVMNLNEIELERLTNHLDHSIRVHKDFYRYIKLPLLNWDTWQKC